MSWIAEIFYSLEEKEINKIKNFMFPFGIAKEPIERLLIVSFEKHPDIFYKGYEIQYFNGLPNGTGYRLLAYRIDGAVDVYDEKCLQDVPEERFEVIENGLYKKVQCHFEEIYFEEKDKRIKAGLKFVDIYGRKHEFHLEEQSFKKTRRLDMLAPMGSNSKSPRFLPVFYLFDFDFVRKRKTNVGLVIDEQKILLDNFPFPVPKDGQYRYYTRYALNTTLIQLFPSKETTLIPINFGQDYIYQENGVTYSFFEHQQRIILKSIVIGEGETQVSIEFNEGICDIRSLRDGEVSHGDFIIHQLRAGKIGGTYQIARHLQQVVIEFSPSAGWSGIPNSFLTKRLFQPNSIFSSWPKTYYYHQEVDVKDYTSVSTWCRKHKK